MNATKTVAKVLALAVTFVVAQSASGADALFSPKAAANQIRRVSGVNNDPDLAHAATPGIFQSPRARANQTRVAQGSGSDRDYVHNQSPLFSGKDQSREQYARYLSLSGATRYQLAPIK